MVVADNRQRFMPLPEDRLPPRGKPLDVPEAVLLVDPVEPEFKGEVLLHIHSSMWSNDIQEFAAFSDYVMVFTFYFQAQSSDWFLVKCRWMTSTNTHVRTGIFRSMVGYALTLLWGSGKSHLAMNSDLVDLSNKTLPPMLVRPLLQWVINSSQIRFFFFNF